MGVGVILPVHLGGLNANLQCCVCVAVVFLTLQELPTVDDDDDHNTVELLRVRYPSRVLQEDEDDVEGTATSWMIRPTTSQSPEQRQTEEAGRDDGGQARRFFLHLRKTCF